jgi:hypothetical protein
MVLTALAQLPIQHAVDAPGAAEARDRTVTYFTKRLAQVQYAAFQTAGYPIGSGPTESANKIVVEVWIATRNRPVNGQIAIEH